jgi:methylphosphotriester-DNA--protein-cysteine methyltransferase
MAPSKEEIQAVLDELSEATYEFSRASQARIKSTLKETAARYRMTQARSAMRSLQNDLVTYSK